MHYGNYQFKCRFEDEAQLPTYKGSTFRGVFGRALKQVVCALKRQECPTCLLRSECLYPAVFEPHLTQPHTGASQKPAPPHPYVIQPPAGPQTLYAKGDGFDFNLLLFGQVNQRLPYFIYAFDQMGRIGVGKKIKGRRGTYRLESVAVDGKVIYTDAEQKLLAADAWQRLALEASEPSPAAPSAVTLTFQTPLRLKHNNHLTPELPFHILVRAMLRRAATLLAHFDGAEPNLDYTGMVRRAQGVQTTQSSLAWEDWRRYSLRQDQAMLMGGLMGCITYEGALEEFLPLIRFCAQTHLGKQTTFGLGRFSLEANQ